MKNFCLLVFLMMMFNVNLFAQWKVTPSGFKYVKSSHSYVDYVYPDKTSEQLMMDVYSALKKVTDKKTENVTHKNKTFYVDGVFEHAFNYHNYDCELVYNMKIEVRGDTVRFHVPEIESWNMDSKTMGKMKMSSNTVFRSICEADAEDFVAGFFNKKVKKIASILE